MVDSTTGNKGGFPERNGKSSILFLLARRRHCRGTVRPSVLEHLRSAGRTRTATSPLADPQRVRRVWARHAAGLNLVQPTLALCSRLPPGAADSRRSAADCHPAQPTAGLAQPSGGSCAAERAS